MVDTASFTKMVPGFDFLQNLVKGAGSALPSIGQWVAPTLDPEELEKRIEELRTVQFWLEQNARMLGATIQALEVQRMTLSTLKTMNVQMADLRDSLTIKSPLASRAEPAAEASPADEPPAPEPSPPPAVKKRSARAKAKGAAAPATAPSLFAAIDPTQAWGALLQQFGQIAANAMKDSAADATKAMAGAMVKQGMDAAGKTFEQAMTAPVKAAAKVAGAAGGMASSAANSAAKAVGKAAGKAAGRLTQAAAGSGANADTLPKPAARKPAAKKKTGR